MSLEDKFKEEDYNRGFWRDTVLLIRAGISPEVANTYHKNISGEEIINLVKLDCSPEQAENYLKKGFFSDDIAPLFEADIPAEQAAKYNKKPRIFPRIFSRKKKFLKQRFNGKGIASLIKEGISPKQAWKYPERFKGNEVAALYSAGCSPEESEKYINRLEGLSIFALYKLGIKPENVDMDKQKQLYKAISVILHSTEIISQLENYKLISTGSAGIVLLKNDLESNIKTAWKFSTNLEHESNLLLRLKNTNNVIRIKQRKTKQVMTMGSDDTPENKALKEHSPEIYQQKVDDGYLTMMMVPEYKDVCIGIELEYINGPTLEELVIKEKNLSPEKTIKYGSQIMNGLMELKKYGIWNHRDIRPANIMIDEYTDNAYIIDLGIATGNIIASPKDNKRFGGQNDMVSLGQVMYYMATGEHIFAQSKSMTMTFSDIKDEINDYRNEVYTKFSLLNKHLKQIDKNIKNDGLRTLIKNCITATQQDYNRINFMFQRYEA